MAIPSWVSLGTISGSTGTLAVTLPSHQAGDTIVVAAQDANETMSTSVANGFVEVGQAGGGTGGGAAASRLGVWIKTATSAAETGPTFADPGNHINAVAFVVRGQLHAIQMSDTVAGGSSTAVSVTGLTTTVADCLVAVLCTWADDSAASNLATVTNASLASITSRHDAGDTTGNGGGIAILTGEKAAAGAVSASTGTLSIGASHQGKATIAFAPFSSGSAAGVATVSAVGSATAEAAASSAGSSTAAAVGEANVEAAGSIAGVGAAAATGSSEAAAVGSSAGVGSAAAVGSSEAEAVGSAAGTATAEAAGSQTGGTIEVEAVGSAAGTSTAAAVSPSLSTTRAELRAHVAALVKAIVPTHLAGEPFRESRYDGDGDFRAEAGRTLQLRRYVVRDLGEYVAHTADNSGRQVKVAEFEVVVCYPHSHKYGKRAALDRDKVAEADRVSIESAIGWRGYSNFGGSAPPATPLVGIAPRRESGQSYDLLVLRARYEFAADPA